MLAGMKRIRLLLVLAFGFGLMACPGCSRGTTTANASGVADLQFAELAFKAMTSGDATAESMVDFETLNNMGMDVGQMYVAIPDEATRTTFRQSFVSKMGTSFKNSGIDSGELKNWRLHSSDATKSVVAADWKNAPLYLTVTKRTGRPLISGVGLAP